MGPRWSDQENVVAVYFISRGIPQDLMPEVLALKCPGSKRRSVHSVRNQIYELRTDCGLYNNKCRARLKRWKLNAVDEWLNKQSVTDMRSLIAYDHDVKKILANVSSFVWSIHITRLIIL